MNEKLGLVVMDSKVVVSSRTVAEVFEKEHKNVLRDIQTLGADEDFIKLNFEPSTYCDRTGRTLPEFLITRDGFTLLAMGFTGVKAMKFKIAYIEAFNKMEEKLKNPYAVKIPQSFPEALRAYANECEQRALAEAQRDEAIRTKAWIGTRREATAMATASTEKRRAEVLAQEKEVLAEQVGDSTNWKTVKSIKWIPEYFAISTGMWSAVGKRLTALSHELDFDIRHVEHSDYGTVNAYHVDVIARLKAKLDADPNMLQKYRPDFF